MFAHTAVYSCVRASDRGIWAGDVTRLQIRAVARTGHEIPHADHTAVGSLVGAGAPCTLIFSMFPRSSTMSMVLSWLSSSVCSPSFATSSRITCSVRLSLSTRYHCPQMSGPRLLLPMPWVTAVRTLQRKCATRSPIVSFRLSSVVMCQLAVSRCGFSARLTAQPLLNSLR